MIARLVLGALVSASSIIMAIYLSGGALSIVPLAAALVFMVLVPAIAGLVGFGFKGIARAFSLAFSPDAGAGDAPDASATGTGGPSSDQSSSAAAMTTAVFALLRKATAGAAALGFLLVQIQMMYDLRDKSDIRLFLSFSFVPALVGLILVACLYAPLEYAVAMRQERLTAAVEEGAAGASNPSGPRAVWPGVRVLAALAACLAVIAGCFQILSVGRLPPLFNPPSAVVMLFFPLGNLLAGPGPGGMARAFAALGRHGPATGAQSRRLAASAFAYLNRSILLAGATAFISGVVYFFQGLNDRMRYGPTMALALVAVFLAGLLLVCVGLPLRAAAGPEAHEGRSLPAA